MRTTWHGSPEHGEAVAAALGVVAHSDPAEIDNYVLVTFGKDADGNDVMKITTPDEHSRCVASMLASATLHIVQQGDDGPVHDASLN